MAPYIDLNPRPLLAAFCTGAVALLATGALLAWALV